MWAKKLLIILLIVFSLVGCMFTTMNNKPDTVSLNNPSYTELTFWLWPGTGFEPLIEQYIEMHPDLKVIIQIAEYGDVHHNLQTAFAAGSGAPDICAIEVEYIDRFKKFSDHFHNLFDYGGHEAEQDFLDWKWQQALHEEDFLIGLPTDIGPIAMAYRTDLFAQAGLPTDREEVAQLIRTWDDFLEVGMLIREKTGSAMTDNLYNLYRVMISQADRKYFDQDTEELIMWDNPQFLRAWNYTMQAYELNLSANLTSWVPEWSVGVNNGDFAVMLAPAWMMGFIKDNAPEATGKWDITWLPEGSGNWGGSFLTLPKEGNHPQEAYDLIRWLTAPNQQLQFFLSNGNFPSTPGIYDHLKDKQNDPYFNDAPIGEIYGTAAKFVKPVYEGASANIIHSTINDLLLDLEDGLVQSEAVWDVLYERIETNLNRTGMKNEYEMGGAYEHSDR